MSFTRLLAASKSLIGLKKHPGPYRLNQEHLLPRFEPISKSNSVGLPESEPAPVPGSAFLSQMPEVNGFENRGGGTRVVGIWAYLSAQFSRLGRRRSLKNAVKRPIQTELALSGVKVVCNDLSDCSFQVRLRAGSERRDGKESRRPLPKQSFGMVWKRLSAGRLRQAAQEFSSEQKERGKLLSQAGHGNPGRGGS